jgi:flavin-dependent dehydrogenase
MSNSQTHAGSVHQTTMEMRPKDAESLRNATSSTSRVYDAVVLGAGPAGLATAITICRETRASVLVADAGPAARERFGESVAPDLLLPLKQLGLLDEFRAGGHAPCPGSASIWGGDRVGYNDYILNPTGPAWRLQRRAFDEMLIRAARESGAELCWATRHLQSLPDEKGHRLLLSNRGGKREVRGRWIVDATGPSARFALHAGARRIVDDRMYGLARYATIHAGSMTMQILLEADEHGWWYAARLPDDRVVVLFASEAETARRLKARGHEGFERSLGETKLIAPILAKLELEGKEYFATPVYSSRLDRPEGEGWLAVGDAAASYDPIVARGITKALEDGVAAGRRIAEPSDSAGSYSERLAARFRIYAEARAHLYELERRDGPFWQKRRERSRAMVVHATET